MGYPSFNAGEVLTAADMNAVGLWRITAETSFTSVSSITLPASTFTSTYKNYRMFLRLVPSTGSTNITFQVRAGSTTATANYYSATSRLLFNNTTSNLFVNNGASATICSVSTNGENSIVLDLLNGFGSTGYGSWAAYGANDNQAGAVFHSALHTVSQNSDAAVISISSGTMTGTYSIYGYKK